MLCIPCSRLQSACDTCVALWQTAAWGRGDAPVIMPGVWVFALLNTCWEVWQAIGPFILTHIFLLLLQGTSWDHKTLSECNSPQRQHHFYTLNYACSRSWCLQKDNKHQLKWSELTDSWRVRRRGGCVTIWFKSGLVDFADSHRWSGERQRAFVTLSLCFCHPSLLPSQLVLCHFETRFVRFTACRAVSPALLGAPWRS